VGKKKEESYIRHILPSDPEILKEIKKNGKKLPRARIGARKEGGRQRPSLAE